MKCTMSEVMKQFWSSKRYDYTKSPRPNSGILYLIKGEMEYITEKDKLTVQPGDILFLPENSYYEVIFCGSVESYLVNFKADEVEIKEPTVICNDKGGIIEDTFARLLESYINDSEAFLTASLFYLLLHNITLLMGRNKENIKLETAKKLLSDEKDYSVEEVARELFISRSSLQKLFKEKIGKSPMQFKMVKKIEKAKLMLSTTDMPIKNIADSLNFYDISYFHKTFKLYTGLTPQKYREKTVIRL